MSNSIFNELADKDIYSFSALHWAAYNGYTETVKDLLEDGTISVNDKSKDGYSALHWATYNGHTEIVKILLEAGAHVYENEMLDNNEANFALKSLYNLEISNEITEDLLSICGENGSYYEA